MGDNLRSGGLWFHGRHKIVYNIPLLKQAITHKNEAQYDMSAVCTQLAIISYVSTKYFL